MKYLYLFIIILLFCIGCKIKPSVDYYEIAETNIHSHTYLIVNGYEWGNMIHAEHCHCGFRNHSMSVTNISYIYQTNTIYEASPKLWKEILEELNKK